MIIAVDIDGILTKETKGHDYENRTPDYYGISQVNELWHAGHRIVLFTARYKQDREKTVKWLAKYEVEYDELIMGKPQYHIFIDDRATNSFTKINELLCKK